MIEVVKVRTLFLDQPAGSYLSAGSGIVQAGTQLYVIADDELDLGIFPADEVVPPGKRVRLFTDRAKAGLSTEFPSELPADGPSRKKLKPDLEVLAWIPSRNASSPGALLALPSGSKPNRTLGSYLPLTAEGTLAGLSRTVNLSKLYARLSQSLPELNVEGACISGQSMRLFQRGNSKSVLNAVVVLELPKLLEAIELGHDLDESLLMQPQAIRHYELGTLRGVPLSFTDACTLSANRSLFLAAAEATESTYDDGEYLGAVVGILNAAGEIENVHELNCPFKPEGIFPVVGKPGMHWLVTDADDVGRASELYQFRFED